MQKLIVLSVFIFIVLLVSLNFYLESRYYVCPNGKLVDFDFQCEKYNPEKILLHPNNFPNLSVDASKSSSAYIKSAGLVNVSFLLRGNAISVYFSPYQYSFGSKYMELYLNNGSRHYVGIGENAEIQATRIMESADKYWVNITAPGIPGNYDLFLYDSEQKIKYESQKITVINPTNETLAYAIADRQLYISFGSSTSFIRNWTTTSKYILDKGNFYETYMENSFDFCDIGVRNFICDSKKVSGKFQISKETGQIIG